MGATRFIALQGISVWPGPEWKVPSFTLNTPQIQPGYVAEAIRIAAEASQGQRPVERIWVNVLHAVDGAWGIAGKAFTNQQLGAAVSKG
jgi:hypothetical protein